MDEARHFIWRNRSGENRGELAAPANAQSLELNGAGTAVAFETYDRKASSREIWTMSTVSGSPVRRTFDPADDADPLWTPDGSAILFTRNGTEAVFKLARDLSPCVVFFDQLDAIADGIISGLRDEKVRPLGREGTAASHWVLIDFGSVVVHAFTPPERDYYGLEKHWSEARTILRVQ